MPLNLPGPGPYIGLNPPVQNVPATVVAFIAAALLLYQQAVNRASTY